MLAWRERPKETANLFNPAFCGTVLLNAIASFLDEAEAPMPLALAYMPLPIVLHEATRNVLPRNKTTSLLVWLQRQPEVRLGFASRMRALIPCTREAIMFLHVYGRVAFDSSGRISRAVSIRSLKPLERQSEEFKATTTKATLVGKMLGKAGKPATIFAVWGVRP